MKQRIIHNIRDRRQSLIGSWEVAPFDPEKVTEADIGRTVLYIDFDGTGEAGTLSSWSATRATFWARFSQGDTAAGCGASDLVWGIRQISPQEIING